MVVKYDNLANIRTQNRDKKIVLTSGTFDLFHVGHLHYLQAVKSYGDVMVVMLSGDARVRTRKSLGRPIYPENDRTEILDALKIVDYVFIDPGNNEADRIDPIYEKIINRLQPDVYVTDGEDVRFSKIMNKSKLVILPRVEGGKYASTSAIIKRIGDVAHPKKVN